MPKSGIIHMTAAIVAKMLPWVIITPYYVKHDKVLKQSTTWNFGNEELVMHLVWRNFR